MSLARFLNLLRVFYDDSKQRKRAKMKSSITFNTFVPPCKKKKKTALNKTMMVLNQLRGNLARVGDQFEPAKTSLGLFKKLFSAELYTLLFCLIWFSLIQFDLFCWFPISLCLNMTELHPPTVRMLYWIWDCDITVPNWCKYKCCIETPPLF